MVDKPTVVPNWATFNVQDPVSGQQNVTTPPDEKQMYGWARAEKPPRQWFNWLGRYTAQWINWFNQQESQAVVSDGTGAVVSYDVFNIVHGALAYIYVVDKGNAANVYHGMCYLPPAPGSPVPFVDIKKVGINTPSISVTGTVTISGGTGPYIAYAQTKTTP